jgi:hypothetical protein
VTGGFEERVAHNESVMRDINERIDAGTWPGPDTELLIFCCECALLGCNLLVELTHPEYVFVRENPRRFLLAPGHELPAVEVVVRREAGYVVVEKVGEAGREAAALE